LLSSMRNSAILCRSLSDSDSKTMSSAYAYLNTYYLTLFGQATFVERKKIIIHIYAYIFSLVSI
jgi:hypothetical protein